MTNFGISICIATNASKLNKTKIELKSIRNAIVLGNLPAEIIMCGDTNPFAEEKDVIFVEACDDAHNGMLALLRNKAAQVAKYDILLFVDDDFLFPQDWVVNLQKYSADNEWEVLTNKILLPCGGRFWDRSSISPHQLLSYDHDPTDRNLYITGGFWLIKKSLFNLEPWDASLKINAMKHGAEYNEDVALSIRMHDRGIPLLLDQENYVWHWDEKYIQRNNVIALRKNYINLAQYKFSEQFELEFKVLV